MSIKAIFYSKFDPHGGPKVIHQVPEDSIITPADNDPNPPLPPPSVTSTASTPLLYFSTISRFLIPRQSLCGNLISLRPPPPTPHTPPTLILSYPICISSPHYPRNEFIFNFSLVLSSPAEDPTIDVPAYKSVVTKLAQLMKSLEQQSQFLSSDTSPSNTGPIYSLCETLMEDLNNYCECMIPIDDLNTLNIKLFPTYPNPPPVKAWHVPLLTVRIEKLVDENWDLTMQRIIPFINGVHSVKKIAVLADADLKLTKKCIKHLLYYGCLLLLDIFSFNAIYAPTSMFEEDIASNQEMQRECARYVNMAFAPGRERERDSVVQNVESNADWPQTATGEMVDGVGIVQLFTSLRQGLSVREWYAQNSNMLANIDMRRFITFGVIKGFLYRVHRYPFATGAKRDGDRRNGMRVQNGVLPRSMSSELHFRERDGRERENMNRESADAFVERVRPFLDGTHCFDEICTELEMSEKDLEERLKRAYPEEVVVVCR